MALNIDILKLLKEEGYRVTEAVHDALDEFLSLVEEENEALEEDLEDPEERLDED